MKPKCLYEVSPFNPCNKPATHREFTFGKTYCKKHALEKQCNYDLKMVSIKNGKDL